MSPATRRLARRLILATSVPPLVHVYRAGYGVVTRLALRLFRGFPQVRAVYLRRGGSKGEIVPLVSDLDFAVIGGPFDEEALSRLQSGYGRLARATRLLDSTLEVFDEDTLATRYRRSPHYRYRFTEGRATWKLLYGRDVLRDLPQLSHDELRGGFFAEVQIWWMLFAWRLLQRRRYHAEDVTRNSLCYKAVAEFLKISLGLREECLVFRREEAIAAALETLDPSDAALVEELRRAARRGFRRRIPDVLERTTSLLLRHGAELCDAFGALEAGSPGRVAHVVHAEPREAFRGAGPVREHLARIVDHVAAGWPEARRVAAAAGAGFNVDEVLVVVELAPGAVPDAARLGELYAVHQRGGPAAARVHPFVRLRDAAFQLDGADLEKSWQALLCPAASPEVFEALADPGATVFERGEPAAGRPRDAGTTGPHARQFLEEERRLFAQILDEPALYKVPALEFQRVFWKTAQLAVAAGTAESGLLRYALTPAAIQRALEELGRPLPASLRGLAQAYARQADGQPEDVGELVPHAVAYLRELAA